MQKLKKLKNIKKLSKLQNDTGYKDMFNSGMNQVNQVKILYLCEQGFSNLTIIKNKQRNRSERK